MLSLNWSVNISWKLLFTALLIDVFDSVWADGLRVSFVLVRFGLLSPIVGLATLLFSASIGGFRRDVFFFNGIEP